MVQPLHKPLFPRADFICFRVALSMGGLSCKKLEYYVEVCHFPAPAFPAEIYSLRSSVQFPRDLGGGCGSPEARAAAGCRANVKPVPRGRYIGVDLYL